MIFTHSARRILAATLVFLSGALTDFGVAVGVAVGVVVDQERLATITAPSHQIVSKMPLANRQSQPYVGSLTIAASIDRAGVRPLLTAH